MPIKFYENEAGEFLANLEMFSYGGTLRKRVTYLKAPLIHKRSSPKGKIQDVPIPLHGAPKTVDLRPLNTNAGHLVGRQFGGPDHAYNLVSMYADFNQHGAWKTLEDNFRNMILLSDGRVTVEINISYGHQHDPRIPSGFSASATTAGGTYRGFGFMPHLSPKPVFFEIDQEESILITERFWQMQKANWKMEDLYSTLKLPDEGVKRPYAVLDYMTEVTKDLAPVSMSNVRKFDEFQINNILTVNRVMNEGYLLSDDPGNDPYDSNPLLDVAGDQGAQVDHIKPRSTQAGSNAYSNAQVISGLANQKKNG